MIKLGQPVIIVVEHTDRNGAKHYAGEIAHISADCGKYPPGRTPLVFGRKGEHVWTEDSYFKPMGGRRDRGTV